MSTPQQQFTAYNLTAYLARRDGTPFTFTLRPAVPSDAASMASIVASAHLHTSLSRFLSPYRYTYLDDFLLGFQQRILTRMSQGNMLSYVASDSGGRVIGYAQFRRDGATRSRAMEQAQSNWWSWLVARPWLRLRLWLWLWLWRPRARDGDPEAVGIFAASEGDYWNGPVWRERWHAVSVAVSMAAQRRGVGTALMRVGMRAAEEDGVPLALEASDQGEGLYRKLGFRLRRRFNLYFEGESGGVMVWTPPGWKGEEEL
ncbi:acyl-CoA N-acyltransferase [Sphaerosporella brunnea]|uniref:Acyl-CoA N-acyltransferase n=1 Tax=Sphaerosporella brunnea TaxID=1250544 RepID=A0A5J5F3S9_9PEZI|nr:acyl-CoA N-acyltransferase [Sphaerosporella brunnea]